MRTVIKAIATGFMAVFMAVSVLPGLSSAKSPSARLPTTASPRLPACHATVERAAFLPDDPAPGCAAPIATDKVVRDHHAERA